eukprot:gnl/TRDRNA2_/TRDRNA2_167818_c0_seq6.p2 gnl/TRDRNA2_/TRDRNA2_167818_c0~~gnl/TRDRNA2_/TRDRNA2_167818_c0_seq6.p2  ORF type:complete len:177 (-),score=11.54 gnl/TRDRNA2_/TRDRNA2_167818_c0_seq6:299-829(-)
MRVFMAGVRNFGSTWPMSLSKMVLLVHVTLSGSRINVALLAPMNPQKFLKVRLDRAAGLRANSIYRRDSPHQPVHVLSPGTWEPINSALSRYGSLEPACSVAAFVVAYVAMSKMAQTMRVLIPNSKMELWVFTLGVMLPLLPTLLVCSRGSHKGLTDHEKIAALLERGLRGGEKLE